LLLVVVYALMAFVRQTEVFFVVAALAGAGWTISASELWVAAQRAMPSWAGGRMNAAIIMISQGSMALGGVLWGSAGAIVGTRHTLLGAAVLFFISLLLARRVSINFEGSRQRRVSGALSLRIKPKELTLKALAKELFVAKSLRTVATLAAALAVIGVASRASANEVARWNQVATDASAVADKTPLTESRVFAILHVAIHDAINTVEPRYELYQPRTGIHFSSAVNAGYVQGERVGEWVFENALRPAKPQPAITASPAVGKVER
jgi:Transmembrane secretion effector